MVLGKEIFQRSKFKGGNVVPIAFPIIAGSGTLYHHYVSVKANYDQLYILIGIIINLVVVYSVFKSLSWIERVLGEGGFTAIRKFLA